MNFIMKFLNKLSIATISTSLSLGANADSNSTLVLGDAYTITIPEINYLGISGYYQNAVLKHDVVSGQWQLQRVKASVPVGLPQGLDSVEAITTTSDPVQVILKVSWFDSGCSEVGHKGVVFDDATKLFTVWIYYTEAYAYPKEPPETACTADVVKISTTVVLPVYGLAAGIYHYDVGGEISGSFTIPTDNVIE